MKRKSGVIIVRELLVFGLVFVIKFCASSCVVYNHFTMINKNKNYFDYDFSVSDFMGSIFLGCDFSSASFCRADFTGVIFKNCTFDLCDFREADLRGSEFLGCDFSGCLFQRADLGWADFSSASFSNCVFSRAKKRGALFPEKSKKEKYSKIIYKNKSDILNFSALPDDLDFGHFDYIIESEERRKIEEAEKKEIIQKMSIHRLQKLQDAERFSSISRFISQGHRKSPGAGLLRKGKIYTVWTRSKRVDFLLFRLELAREKLEKIKSGFYADSFGILKAQAKAELEKELKMISEKTAAVEKLSPRQERAEIAATMSLIKQQGHPYRED